MSERDDETPPPADAPDTAPEAAGHNETPPPADAPDTAPEAARHDETAAGADETPAVADDLKPAQREVRAQRLGRRAPIVAGVAALVAATLLGFVIMTRSGGLPFEFDEEWAEDLLELQGPVGDVFAYFMNALGGGVVGVFVVPVVTAVVLLIVRRPWAALYFILASAASAGVVQLLKHLYGRERPDNIVVASDFGSFPSGHVANAATIAVALGVIMPHVWVWVLGTVYTVLMAISRTYLGAHWLSDTIGGLLVGAGVALLIWAVLATPLERERLAWTARLSARNAERAQAHITPPAR